MQPAMHLAVPPLIRRPVLKGRLTSLSGCLSGRLSGRLGGHLRLSGRLSGSAVESFVIILAAASHHYTQNDYRINSKTISVRCFLHTNYRA